VGEEERVFPCNKRRAFELNLKASFFILTVKRRKKNNHQSDWSWVHYWSDEIHDPWIDEMCNQLLKFAFISNSVEQNKKFMIQWMKCCDQNQVRIWQSISYPINNTSAMTKLRVLVLSFPDFTDISSK
jgi:hypothetical protein